MGSLQGKNGLTSLKIALEQATPEVARELTQDILISLFNRVNHSIHLTCSFSNLSNLLRILPPAGKDL